MRYNHQSIPDRSRPKLPTTASGVAQQGTCGNYATAKHSENKSRKRGGRRAKRQRKVWKGRRSLIRMGVFHSTLAERPRICRKKDDGNGSTGKEEKSKDQEKIFRCCKRRYGGSWFEGDGR